MKRVKRQKLVMKRRIDYTDTLKERSNAVVAQMRREMELVNAEKDALKEKARQLRERRRKLMKTGRFTAAAKRKLEKELAFLRREIPLVRSLFWSKVKALEMRLAAAKPLNGFPRRARFRTLEEARDYLDHDKLQCLICGRRYPGLAQHLDKNHLMRADEYREMFGIPWTYPLSGQNTRRLHKKKIEKQRRRGQLKTPPPLSKRGARAKLGIKPRPHMLKLRGKLGTEF
jgi:hypothetical protein